MTDFNFNYVVTDEAAAAISSMLQHGYPAIQITKFAVGTGGFSPANPTVALMPSAAAAGLANEIFRSSNITRTVLDPRKTLYTGNLMPNEGVGALGEAGFFAMYSGFPDISLGVPDPRNGTEFLFAVLNFGMITKSSRIPLKVKLPVVI